MRSKSRSSISLTTWLMLALLVIVADQLTKVLIVARFAYGDSVTLTGYFNLVRVHNTGAAFSFLADAAGWQRWFFITLGIAASGMFIWLLRSHASQKLFAFSVSMLLGGAIGNVIDRAWHGYVVDFLQFHWDFLAPIFPGGYFPSFNVADCAITAGAIGLILDEIGRVRRS
ncbi:lipoprotein signal peptidase [Leptothrix cholodnii SP-6]|uniref:Lipoprotein signal peptidase n=1 Tax=Leptothrix cholodnii (strain ATCC 51168 / LMG 8142 / SP-6) TaxID=395495 RepID=B1Y5B5_LEPCP|nr:signal peptidase II [Leptothrix cholodnii]ACB33503.1 lipoprotein signal peptidase [Leptothrix cholodnii SP-6]